MRKHLFYIITILIITTLINPSLFANTYSPHHSAHLAKRKKHKHPAKKLIVKKTPTISSRLFDQQYLAFLRRWEIPGATVAIMQHNQLILSRGYGYADLAAQRPMTPDAVFRIGSVSKAITAVTILKLVQEGKLGLDSKAYSILNDLQPLTNGRVSPKVSDITVRNLLEMSSGWTTDHGIDPMLGEWSLRMLNQLNGQIPPDCRTAARLMMTIPMQYAPGTQFSYSNFNYCLLGLIINKVTGSSGASGYETYVKQHLLAPYGITTMQIGSNAPGHQVPNEVHYYFHESEPNKGRIDDGLPYGYTHLLEKNFSDGGWLASAPDLIKFLQALSQYKILTPGMIKTMTSKPYFQKQYDHYFAKGWSVKFIQNHRLVLKTGSFTGTQALIMMDESGAVYVALFNAKPSNRKIFLGQLENKLVTYAYHANNQ